MLGLFTPTIKVLEKKEDRLTFVSPRNLSAGRSHEVKLADSRRVRVLVESVRPLERGYAVTGKVGEEVTMLTPTSAKDAFVRKDSRVDCAMRVLSPDLPGYRAVTVDFSHGGVQVETEGPLATGRMLDLTLEYDNNEMASVRCQARVAWCAERSRARYRVGLQFVNPSPEANGLLGRMEELLTTRDETSIHKRTIGADAMVQRSAAREETPVTAELPGVIDAYCNRNHNLVTQVRQSSGMLELTFPSCQAVRDYNTASGVRLSSLREYSGSELCTSITRRTGQGGWRHYQFVDANGQIVMEVVSQGVCHPGGRLTKEEVARRWNELWESMA